MKLIFDATESSPHGKWYATTDDGNYDGAGASPLDAVSNLVCQMEREGATSR